MQGTKREQTEVIDLTENSSGSDCDIPSTSKRHKPDATQQPTKTTTPSPLPSDRPPVALFRVKNTVAIAPWASEGPLLNFNLAGVIVPGIKYAIISNFKIDLPWLLSACPALLDATKLLFLCHHSAEDQIKLHAQQAGLYHPHAVDPRAADRTFFHSPPLPLSFGVHHSKAFIIQYDRGIRIIIMTANLVYCDCNNKTQAAYVQDFPLKDSQSATNPSEFEKDLLEYINALGIPFTKLKEVQKILSLYDYSAARVRVVGSVPGYHKESKLYSWGHMKLRSCLNRAPGGGFDKEFIGAPIVGQFSSMGSLDVKWLENEFRASCSAGNSNGSTLGLPKQPNEKGFQLVWPTVSEIQNSGEGWFAGGSVPGTDKNVNRPFLLPYYHRWSEDNPVGRQRAMPHIKTYARYNPETKDVAWYVVTSHNLSKAAWGQLQKNNTQLAIRHYELGVLCLPGLEEAYLKSRWRGFNCTADNDGTTSNLNSNKNNNVPNVRNISSVKFTQWRQGLPQTPTYTPTNNGAGVVATVPLPIPYSLAPKPYIRHGVPPSESDKPWVCDVSFQGVDTFGRTIDEPHGSVYGLVDQMEWTDV